MSPTILTVKIYKYLRENPLGKIFPRNITRSSVPPYCIKNFLREKTFMTSSLGTKTHPQFWSLGNGMEPELLIQPTLLPSPSLASSLNFLPLCTLLSAQVAASLLWKEMEMGGGERTNMQAGCSNRHGVPRMIAQSLAQLQRDW